VVGDVRGLQLIQPIFGARILQPAQAIEKIMQAIARGNLAGAKNESLVGFAFRQDGLGNKLNTRSRQQLGGRGIQSLRTGRAFHHALR
jgi:hypothetical protein